MTIPDYQTVMLPLLRFASDGEEHSLREAIEKLADHFDQLVEEGYIAISSMQKIDGLPWIVAFPQALTTKGLLEIGELPDSNARLLGSLNAIEEAIARLNVDDQHKTAAMKAAEELKDFLHQLPRQTTARNARAIGNAPVCRTFLRSVLLWVIARGRYGIDRHGNYRPRIDRLEMSRFAGLSPE